MKLGDLDLLELGNTIEIGGIILTDHKNGKNFVALLPENDAKGETDVLYMSVPDWEKFFRQTDLIETQIFATHNGILKKIIVRKTERQINQNVAWRVYKRDGYKCRYCGRDNVPLTVDHLVLWEKGGPTIEANLLSSCKNCNKKRGNMEYFEWLETEYYLNVSAGLTDDVRQANLDIVDTLGDIPVKLHIQNRGGGKKKKKRR